MRALRFLRVVDLCVVPSLLVVLSVCCAGADALVAPDDASGRGRAVGAAMGYLLDTSFETALSISPSSTPWRTNSQGTSAISPGHTGTYAVGLSADSAGFPPLSQSVFQETTHERQHTQRLTFWYFKTGGSSGQLSVSVRDLSTDAIIASLVIGGISLAPPDLEGVVPSDVWFQETLIVPQQPASVPIRVLFNAASLVGASTWYVDDAEMVIQHGPPQSPGAADGSETGQFVRPLFQEWPVGELSGVLSPFDASTRDPQGRVVRRGDGDLRDRDEDLGAWTPRVERPPYPPGA